MHSVCPALKHPKNEGLTPQTAFQLTQAEFAELRSQSVTSSWGGLRYPPYAFSEQGVAMLSSVLKSPRAVKVNIEIMRAFVRLRHTLATHEDLLKKLDALEKRYDSQFTVVFQVIRKMSSAPTAHTPKIGFSVHEDEA